MTISNLGRALGLSCFLLHACGDDDGSVPDAGTHDSGFDAAAEGGLDARTRDASMDDAGGADASDVNVDAALDAGPSMSHQAAMECFADIPPHADGILAEVTAFHSTDGAWKIARARRAGERPGAVGETTAYDLVGFWAQRADEPALCVTDGSGFAYHFVHHNWDDTWSVTTGDTRYEAREQYELYPVLAWTYTLQVFDRDATTPREDLVLVADTCWYVPTFAGQCRF